MANNKIQLQGLTTDDDGNIFADSNSPIGQYAANMVNGTSGPQVNLFQMGAGVFQTVTGLIDQDTANVLRRDLRDTYFEAEDRRAAMRERFARVAEHFQLEHTLDVGGLFYNDANRANPAEWLERAGWTVEAQSAADEMRRLDRWLDIPGADDPDAWSSFVVAGRG